VVDCGRRFLISSIPFPRRQQRYLRAKSTGTGCAFAGIVVGLTFAFDDKTVNSRSGFFAE
jgi:hypothetical protein